MGEQFPATGEIGMTKRHFILIDEREFTASVSEDGTALIVELEGTTGRIELSPERGPSLRTLTIGGKPCTVGVNRTKEGLRLTINGEVYAVDVTDPRSVRYAAVAKATATIRRQIIKAPMPGMIVKLLVKEGERVSKGQPLVILNAMKLENDIRSPTDAIVTAVHVAADQPVDKGTKLVTLG